MLRVEDHPGGIRRYRMRKVLAGRPLHEVSAWWIPPGILIDSGPPLTATELVEALRPDPPKAVLVTHHHEDHVGGLPALIEAFGIIPIGGEITAELLSRPRRIPFYRSMVWGTPVTAAIQTIASPTFDLLGLHVEMVPTPGHAWDHVAFNLPERRQVLSGDLYVHPRVTYLRRIEDPWAHLASLRALIARNPATLLCAHAGLVAPAIPALEAKIAFWEGLAERAQALRASGESVSSISRRLLGRDGAFRWLSGGDFSKRNLIAALVSSPE